MRGSNAHFALKHLGKIQWVGKAACKGDFFYSRFALLHESAGGVYAQVREIAPEVHARVSEKQLGKILFIVSELPRQRFEP